jgi:phosphatidylserine decarboxylase
LKYSWADAPGRTAFPIARAGFPYIGAGAFVTLILALLQLALPALLVLAATFFVCFFFRDPDRVIPTAKGAIVSPADGKVVVAKNVEDPPIGESPCLQVSVFMNIFNVHVNRCPADGEVTQVAHQPGRFIMAHRDDAVLKNEHNRITVKSAEGFSYHVVQIAGLVARRIICHVTPGHILKRGERFGLICFGSRLDIYLPPETRLTVDKGDKVRAGSSILGYLHETP